MKRVCLWTLDYRSKVFKVLAPVLGQLVGIKVDVVESLSALSYAPDLIVGLGGAAKDALEASGQIPKNRTITSLRGRVLPVQTPQQGTVPMVVSYSTNIAETDYGKYVDLLCDFAQSIRYVMTGAMEPTPGAYQYVTDLSKFLEEVEALHEKSGKPVEVAYDLETLGLDEFAVPTDSHPGAYIVSIQVSHTPGTASVVYFPSRDIAKALLSPGGPLQAQVDTLLNSPKISLRGANCKYDLRWTRQHIGVTCSNFKFDTTLVGSLLDENRSNGLDVHAKIYSPMGGYSDVFDRSVDKSRMDLVPKDKLLLYAGGDADATLQVSQAQKPLLLGDSSLARFYVNILHPAAQAFEIVESGGIFVDKSKLDALEVDLAQEIGNLIEAAKLIVGGRIVAKHFDQKKFHGINLTKASFIIDFMFSPMGLNLRPKMFTAKEKTPSTAMEHLEMFADDERAAEFIKVMREYASATKTLSTYVVGFRQHIRSDGRMHPSYYFFAGNRDQGEGGTVTGRLSCKDPAFQCMVGETIVTTDKGPVRLDELVRRGGVGYKVLTHTGQWRDIVGVYRNGVRPVFKVTTRSGKSIVCTGNHPILTQRGWVLTEDLKVGDTAYADKRVRSWAPNTGVHQPDVLQLGGDEESMSVQDQQGLEELRGPGGQGVRTLAVVPGVPGGYGTEAGYRLVDREGEQRQGLRAGELYLGSAPAATEQSSEHCVDHLQGLHSDGSSVGEAGGYQQRMPALPVVGGGEDAPCLETFEVDEVAEIISLWERETYDLTIDRCHSFVANGIVVHNTLPKHTKWAKRLRECYVAPPGYVVVEMDYNQGELRVIACVANESTMIAAYRQNRDLHAITSGRFAGYSYDEMMALKKADKEKFGAIRQLGKAGNFGLIYGMSADGFHVYAEGNYGVKLGPGEAGAFRNGFFDTYPGLPTYHKEYKAFARRHGYVRSPLGRIRHLPLINSPRREEVSKAERQAINSPIQSTLSDLLIWSVSDSVKDGWNQEAPCFGVCHDAGYRYVLEDRVEEHVKRAVHGMENLNLSKMGWTPQLQFTADAKVGPDMGNLVEMHF